MNKAFAISFRLRTAYKANGFIYYLRQLPLIKKLIPVGAYGSRGIKIFANIVSILLEIFNTFAWKLMYVAIIFAMVVSMKTEDPAAAFLHAFFFLTIVGGFLNTNLFDPTNDKYYAIVLMRMDAKQYTLSNYIYFLIRVFVGFLPSTCLFAALLDMPWYAGIVMAFYVVLLKLTFSGFILWDNKKDLDKGTLSNDKRMLAVIWIAAFLLCAAAFVPPYIDFVIPMILYPLVLILLAAASVVSAVYMGRSRDYDPLYRELLSQAPARALSSQQTNAVQNMTLKKIELSTEVDSQKTGYAYFNDLFFKRHKKLLHKPAKRICVVSALLFVVLAVVSLVNTEARTGINAMLMTMLPYFLFIMYLIHPGRGITQAMFMNCDHSMLSFRFYRQPKVIISLFVERLKSLMLIGLGPAVFIGAELTVLLAITGGTQEPLNYGILFVSIIMMSLFFSVHYMVLYYLLQPYNVQLESRNAAYGIANALTYVVCYMAIGWRIPTLYFGIALILFCIVYSIAALLLVYRMAPKTFKLR